MKSRSAVNCRIELTGAWFGSGWMTNVKPNLDGVYAIGDLFGGPMLAHKAMEEGMMAVERIHGEKSLSQLWHHHQCGIYNFILRLRGGRSVEQAATEQGYEVKTGSFSFLQWSH